VARRVTSPAIVDVRDGRESLRICVLGAGHVGLVTAAGMSAVGHNVTAYDVDRERIGTLRAGGVPFFEPWLEEVLEIGRRSGCLTFHDEPAPALSGADLVFICVDTSARPDGGVNLTAVTAAALTVARHASDHAVLVIRSTAPVGTADYVRSIVAEERGVELEVVANPEFLAEGTAVRDFLTPDRVVVGSWSSSGVDILSRAYAPIVGRGLPADLPPEISERAGPADVPFMATDPPTAELTKYAANAFLAMRVSFINEIAAIAEEVGADVQDIARGVGLDHRIGPHFLRAGLGWGGSCFPKDILALQGIAKTYGLNARMLSAANEVNASQHAWVIRKLRSHMKTLFGRRVGLLGLTFKPQTDDLRHAPAIEIASSLTALNVRVRGFDPAVVELPPDTAELIELAPDPITLARGLDALVLVTEWPEFAALDLRSLRDQMRYPLLLDGRNFLDPEAVRAAGLHYIGVGRGAWLRSSALSIDGDGHGVPLRDVDPRVDDRPVVVARRGAS
jgi:UDPglucose 6-dehydrogenase